MKRLVGAFALAVALGMAAPVHAQTAPSSGDVRSTLPQQSPTAPAPATGDLAPAPAQRRSQIPSGGPRIAINTFEIAGNTAIPTDELLAQIASLRGKSLTLLEIYDAADVLSDYYHARGYDLASVTVPAQKVSSGTVKFVVLEGRVGTVAIEGQRRYGESLLRSHLDQIKPGDVIGVETLTNQMLRLGDLPGLDAKAIQQPGEALGTTDVTVRVEEDPFEFGAALDNHGRDTIGRYRTSVGAAINNPLKLGDRVEASVVFAQGGALRFGSLAYDAPLTHRGTRGRISASRHLFDVEEDTAGLDPRATDLRGDGTSVRAEILHPFIRSRSRNLFVGIAALRDASDTSDKVVGTGGKDERKAVNLVELLGLITERHPDDSVTTVSATVSSNFKKNRVILAGRNAGELRNNAQRGKGTVAITHRRNLFGPWNLFARFTAGGSLDPLMDVQRFRLGGPGNVRGYQSAALAGDDSLFWSAEVSRPFHLGEGVDTSVRLYWDAGIVYRKSELQTAVSDRGMCGPANNANPARNPAPDKGRCSLTSVGAGVTVDYDRFKLDVDAAIPTHAQETTDGLESGRIWAKFRAQF